MAVIFGRHRWSLLACVLSLVASPILSQDLAPPAGKPILQIGGMIERTTDGSSALFDLSSLEALGLETIRTESPWTDGIAVFEGVPLSALAEFVGATGSEAVFLAHDGYTISIPVSDFEIYSPVLATRRDGNPMRIRDKGPTWVIYPWTDRPEIQREDFYAKAIWQVASIVFE